MSVFIRVELILTFDQLWKQYPALSILHFDTRTHIICTEYTIPASAVTGISQPPSCLLKMDCTYSHPSLQPLQGQV